MALPPNTPQTETQALLRACDTAYQAGECIEPRVDPPEIHIMAEVVWTNDMQAEITVRCETPQAKRSAYRALEFRPEDDVVERFRSLGFAIGSMAGDVGQAATSGPEPPEPPEPSDDVVQPPAPTPPPARAFEDAPDPPSTTVVMETRDEYRFGLLSGSGLGGMRWGLVLGGRRVWNSMWLVDAAVGYATQNSNDDDVEGSFVNLALTTGATFTLNPLQLAVSAGPAYQWQRFTRSPAGKSQSVDRLGVDFGLFMRYGKSVIAPFLDMRGSGFVPVDVGLSRDESDNPDDLRTFGPMQGQVVVGVAFSPGDTSSGD